MAYVFRIHNHANGGPTPQVAANVKDWTKTQYFEGLLNNAIKVRDNVGSIGTSIPNIFARIMLFDIAFSETAKNMHSPATPTANTKIISECLDMLELLYQKGNDDKHLIVKKWDAASQIQYLTNSGNAKLQNLAKVLQANLQFIGNPLAIYLFYWKDVPAGWTNECEVLIGGTSPLSLVFTSPNWVRKLKDCGWQNKFQRTGGGKMFDDNHPLALENRHGDFRKMLFDMRMAYSDVLDSQAKGLYQYIKDAIGSTPVPPIDPATFLATYSQIDRNDIGFIAASALPLVYKQIAPNDNYVMRISQTLAPGVKTPMALTDGGLGAGVPYIGGQPWNNTIDEAYVRTIDIFERQLPGGVGVKYPFVCASDFLEDNIIEIDAPIKRDKFLTLTTNGANGAPTEQKYLMPLKPTFFKFFKIVDLKNMMEITPSGSDVVVTLKIPVNNAAPNIITMRKTYDRNHIHKVGNNQIGFYPFYKVVDKPALNRYAVASTGTPRLSFFNEDGSQIVSQPTERTKSEGMVIATNYYMVKSGFDYVVVDDGGVRGMIVPIMPEIMVTRAGSDYKFAIDFGTSNTMVAYRIDMGTPIEMNVKSSDYAVYLHKHTNTYYTFLTREFMPTTFEDDASVAFPVKTAVCEKWNYHTTMGNVELFGMLNAGFNFMKEDVYKLRNSYQYATDLKWSLESNPGNTDNLARVRHFCMSILWLAKNVALMGQGKVDFEVYLTFPKSMLGTDIFYDGEGGGAWEWAARELGLTNIHFNDNISESEAPYYKMVNAACDMLNVDIGGGTTDLFFVVKSAMPNYCKYQSVRFAANDLWDDGYGVSISKNGSNGFVQYIKNTLAGSGQDISKIIETASSSADVMAVLFSRDNQYNTSGMIKANAYLRSILVLHFTALLFHIARIIKRQDLPIPRDITFSGMGSLYIGLFKTKAMLSFVRGVLTSLTGKQVPTGFNLKFGTKNEAKQNTALGALARDLVVAAANAFDLSNLEMSAINEQGIDGDILRYDDVANDNKNGNRIYQQSKAIFDQFVEYLRSHDYQTLSNNTLGFGVEARMIDDLARFGGQSYNNVKAKMPTTALAATIHDSLFFWHIKDALYELSVRYNSTNN